MESSQRGAETPMYAPGASALPRANALVALARDRLAREVAALPPYGSPLLAARLRRGEASLGVLVHLLRVAVRLGDAALARDLFVLVLDRTQGLQRAWATQTCATAFAHADSAAESLREDLLQEATLHLWEQLALHDGEAWELFFQRSLDYAQRHIATAVMQQRGYWRRPGVTHPSRVLARQQVALLPHAEPSEPNSRHGNPFHTGADELSSGSEDFDRAELADLRALVTRLPRSQAVAVVMRYWQHATDAEIAEALGGVTTRTVRNYLRRAHQSLRGWYVGAAAAAGAGASGGIDESSSGAAGDVALSQGAPRVAGEGQRI